MTPAPIISTIAVNWAVVAQPVPTPIVIPPAVWQPAQAVELLTYVRGVGKDGLDPRDYDAALLDAAQALPQAVRDRMDRLAFHDALEDVWRVIRAANAYIDHQAPWALRKTDTARMASVLNVLVEVIRCVATVLQPFMPGSMAAMLDQVGAQPGGRGLADLAAPLPPGLALPAPQGVFPRFTGEAG